MSLPTPTETTLAGKNPLWAYTFQNQMVVVQADTQPDADIAMQAILDANAATLAAAAFLAAIQAANPWPLTFLDGGSVTFFPPDGYHGLWQVEIVYDANVIGAGEAVFGRTSAGQKWCETGSFMSVTDITNDDPTKVRFAGVVDEQGAAVIGDTAGIVVSTGGNSANTITVYWRRLSEAPW